MKRAAALLIVLALVLAACGDDDTTATTAGSDGTTATTAGAPATTAAGGQDVIDELTQELLDESDTPFTDEQAACFAVGLVDEFGGEFMVNALQMSFDDFMAQASQDERMTVVDTMLECVDFGAMMVAEVDGAISDESARCIGDAFAASEAFRTALANSFDATAGDPFEDDALMAEVFPSLLECLSAEELLQLGGSEG